MSGPPGAGLGFAIVRALDWFGCCTPSSSRTRSGGDPPPAGRPITVVESPPTQAALQEHLIGIDARCSRADEAPQQAPGSPLRRASGQGALGVGTHWGSGAVRAQQCSSAAPTCSWLGAQGAARSRPSGLPRHRLSVRAAALCCACRGGRVPAA